MKTLIQFLPFTQGFEFRPLITQHLFDQDDYHIDRARLHLRNAATNGPTVHPQVRTMLERYQQGKTPDSSTGALWQSYQHSHLVAKQEEMGEGNGDFGLTKHLCSYFKGIFTMV
jgi:hypothetical protein